MNYGVRCHAVESSVWGKMALLKEILHISYSKMECSLKHRKIGLREVGEGLW